MTSLLKVENLSHRFGGLRVLQDVSFDVRCGEIKSLIGPNGAGKTTLLNVIAGVTPLQRGRVVLDGVDISHLPMYRRARSGIGRSFQNLQRFGRLTALESVMTGLQAREPPGFLAGCLQAPSERRAYAKTAESAYAWLALGGLEQHANVPTSDLSYGDAKILDVIRAAAPSPALLLLDEPLAGLPVTSTKVLANLIRRFNAGGTTIVLIEHNMTVVMEISDSIVVLHNGNFVADGPPAAIRAAPAVIDAYLGQGGGA